MARPRGTYGPIALALLDAARAGPGTVNELAERARVGQRLARMTASRLLERGDLRATGPGRPAVLVLPAGDTPQDSAQRLSAALSSWFGAAPEA